MGLGTLSAVWLKSSLRHDACSFLVKMARRQAQLGLPDALESFIIAVSGRDSDLKVPVKNRTAAGGDQ
jgi:hypothetical protein